MNSAGAQSFYKTSDLTMSPAERFSFIDVNPHSICFSAFVTQVGGDSFFHFPAVHHAGSGVLSFVDGHVESHKWLDERTLSFKNINHTERQKDNPDLKWLQGRATGYLR